MPLSSTQIKKYKTRLEELKEGLQQHITSTTSEVKDAGATSGYKQHQADEGTDDFDRTTNLEITSQEIEKLQQIERALEKINEKTYGVCDVTGKDIPTKRLDAIPYATMTIEAQEKMEENLQF